MLPNVATELLRRQDEDQRARTALAMIRQAKGQQRVEASADESQTTAEVVRIDQANTRLLKNIVERHGWPGQSLVGH
ncbi:MAG: hypothetical protein ACRDTX_18315 [Pseudonocardiaceae bacterium]